MTYKHINIIGLGYIGLPTAAILADSGYKVRGVDISHDIIKKINNGETHFYEPDLDELVVKNISNGNLEAKINSCPSDIFIICVPTPFKLINGIRTPDITYIDSAAEEISKYVKKGDLIILESTSPVGTTKRLAEKINTFIGGIDGIHFAYCPERVLPGNIIKELVDNDRIVGGLDEVSTDKAVSFYKTFINGSIHATNANTAEMCKLTENSFRDVNIAFANELSIVCHEYDINERELIKLANFHPRVNILQPGVGVGGHCIAVDPWFLISDLPNETKLIKSAREVNLNKTEWVIGKIIQKINHFIMESKLDPTIACMGVSFKANVDDLRESPALEVALKLKDLYQEVLIVDPNIQKSDNFELAELEFALSAADIFIFLVGHDDFSSERVVAVVKSKSYIDFTGVTDS